MGVQAFKRWLQATEEGKDFIRHEVTAISEAMIRWALQNFCY